MSSISMSFFKSENSHNGNKFTLVSFIPHFQRPPETINFEIYGSNDYKYEGKVEINNKVNNDPFIFTFIASKGVNYFIKLVLKYGNNSVSYTKFYSLPDDFNENIDNNENLSNENLIQMEINKFRKENIDNQEESSSNINDEENANDSDEENANDSDEENANDSDEENANDSDEENANDSDENDSNNDENNSDEEVEEVDAENLQNELDNNSDSSENNLSEVISDDDNSEISAENLIELSEFIKQANEKVDALL